MVLLRRTSAGNAQYELNGTGAWKEVHLPGARRKSVQTVTATQSQVSYTDMLQQARTAGDLPALKPVVAGQSKTDGDLPALELESDGEGKALELESDDDDETGQAYNKPCGSEKRSSNVQENLRNMVLQYSFDAADKDKNGTLSKAEFGLFLRRAMPDMATKIINQAWFTADTNGDNSVSFQEFTKWLKREEQKALVGALNESVGTHGNAMAALFRVWDTDESGKISKNELRGVITTICPKMADNDLEMMFQAMDSDNDGKVDFREFIKFIGLSS